MRNPRNGREDELFDEDLLQFESECALTEVEASATDVDRIAVVDPQTLRALVAGGLADGGIASASDHPSRITSLFAIPKSRLIH
jgi:hypothetical protein